MSDTPLSYTGSWVDLSGEVMSSGTVSPIVPLGNDSHFMRMLREAQGETSSHTSCRVSPYMSHNSPKSPPNSPNNGRSDGWQDYDLTDVYINTNVAMSDFIWDWSSRPNIFPPKEWKLTNSNAATVKAESVKRKVFSSSKSKNKFMYTVVITNIISLIIGAGIGVWLFRSKPEQIIVPR